MGRKKKKLRKNKKASTKLSHKKKVSKQNEMSQEHKDFYDSFDKRHEDPFTIDIKTALNWFLDYMGQDEWIKRRQNVIQYFNEMGSQLVDKPEKYNIDSDKGRLAFYNDWIAWYLYLAESLADRPAVDEPSQSSRIWPFFATIGKHVDDLKRAKGIDSKLHELLKEKRNQPDSVLFELVVAIGYLRNGWEVEFIPEGAEKTPDLRVVRGEEELFVECKRLAKVTDYSENERTEWMKRWDKVRPLLMKYPKSVFIDVEFKKEVHKTDEDIIAKAFHDMASCGAVAEGFCVENEEVRVCARHMDMKRISDHLDKWMVKYPSPQILALFDDDYEPEGSYTNMLIAKFVTIAPDEESVLNRFVDDIQRAYCAKWICTDHVSIDKKARVVKNLLVKAVNQAPKDGSTVIHIGYETLHGPEIEFLRDRKIVELFSKFNFNDKDITSIFCHAFQPRNFPNNEWDFAETTRSFGFSRNPDEILAENLLLEREGVVKAKESHWYQDLSEKLMNQKA
jgi:hypothetical protein